MLYPLTKDWGHTPYCVPTSLAFLTGVSLKQAHITFGKMRGLMPEHVKGVQMGELAAVLAGHDMWLDEADVGDATTLLTAARRLSAQPFPYVLQVNHSMDKNTHLLVGHGGWLADNWTMRPVPIDEFRHM